MATAPSLILEGPTLNLKNHLYHSRQPPPPPSFAYFRVRIISFGTLSVKCSLPINNSRGNNDSPDARDINKQIGFLSTETMQNPLEFVVKSIINALKTLRKPAAAAVLVGLLLMCDPNSALAAGSGGRMGGNFFSSRSSMSSSSSSSYSSPKTTSSYSAPKSSSRSSAPKSRPRSRAGSNFGLSSDFDFSCSVPPSPSPVSGVYLRTSVGVSPSSSSDDLLNSKGDPEAAAIVFLIVIAFAAFILVFGYLFERSESSVALTATEKTSVLKLQVGFLGLGRSFQKDLNRIAETADTSSSEGLHYVLTETVLVLLRHPDYCISTFASVDVKRSMGRGEKIFNQLSLEERGKFDEETLVNVDGIQKQSSMRLRASGFSDEYIVITILVAAGGEHKLPSINNSKDLKEALQKLASIPSSRILAVEVLWTPQNEDDTLSERELLEDYPLLRPL